MEEKNIEIVKKEDGLERSDQKEKEMKGEKDEKEPGRKVPNNLDSLQLAKRAEDLAKTVNGKKELYRDTETWSTHQELAKILKKIIITDLDFALDRKLEQLLWNSCFKNYISHLQVKSKDRRAKDRGSAHVTLSWFLENASGFYILLLEEIRFAFSLSVPFLHSGSPYGTTGEKLVGEEVIPPSPASCNYICQYCLVHLGDIARYRNNIQQAETFYRHAISMAPSSGQPYNQIAILEANRSNKLSTVYFYVRAVSLSFPFPAAFINLNKLLSRLAGLGEAEEREPRERTAKVTQHTFIPLFLRVHGLLQHSVHLSMCVKFCRLLTDSLTSLIATDSLSTWQLLQMISINMWVWDQASVSDDREQLSREEKVSMAVCADLQAAVLSSSLLPVYTVKKGDDLVDYFALPAVRILLEWILLHPEVLREKGFTSRPQIWPSLARLLNEVQILLPGYDCDTFKDYPLPEEYDLQAFKPIAASFTSLNFKQVNSGQIYDKDELAHLRFYRILMIGEKLSKDPFLLLEKDEGEWRALEREYVQVEDEDLSEALDTEKGENDSSEEDEDESDTIQWEKQNSSGSKGILKSKPAVQDPGTVASAPRYRARQNVAMAAILRANTISVPDEDEEKEDDEKQKRVMFKTPSPVIVQANTKTSGKVDSKTSAAKSTDCGTSKASSAKPEAGGGVPLSVSEFDFTKPPPSLHSNYRPPKLSSPKTEDKPGKNIVKTELSVSGINPLSSTTSRIGSGLTWDHQSSPDPDKSSHSVLGPGGPSQIGGPSFTYNSGAFQQGFGLGVMGRQAEPLLGGQGPVGQVGFGHSSLGQGVAPGTLGQGPLTQGPLGQGPLVQDGLRNIVYSLDGQEEKFPPLGQSHDRSGAIEYKPGFMEYKSTNMDSTSTSSIYSSMQGLGLGWPTTTDQSNQSLFGTLSRSLNPSNSPSSPAHLPSSPAHLTSSPAHLPSMFSSPALSVGSDPPTYSLFSGTSWTGSFISGVESSPGSLQSLSPSISTSTPGSSVAASTIQPEASNNNL